MTTPTIPPHIQAKADELIRQLLLRLENDFYTTPDCDQKAIVNDTLQLPKLLMAEEELFHLRNKCGICMCPEHLTDEACVSCVTGADTVFDQLNKCKAVMKKLADRLAEHDGCSRYHRKDAVILKEYHNLTKE